MSELSKLLDQMRSEMALEKTAAAPNEPAQGESQQNADPLTMAGDVLAKITNFLQAGQGQVDPAGAVAQDPSQQQQTQVDPATGQPVAAPAGAPGMGGGVSRVSLEIPEGMTIKVASEIKTREEAVRFLLAFSPEAFAGSN